MTTNNSSTAYIVNCFGNLSLGTVALLFVIFFSFDSIDAQSNILFTKSFTKKIEKAGIDFYQPTERWLKLKGAKRNEYFNYDVSLYSPPDVEVKIKIDSDKKTYSKIHPSTFLTTSLASIASNDQAHFIKISLLDPANADSLYNADMAAYAEFTPKEGFSRRKKGRLLCIYKAHQAMVSFVILYDEALDPYFKIPMKFYEDQDSNLPNQ